MDRGMCMQRSICLSRKVSSATFRQLLTHIYMIHDLYLTVSLTQDERLSLSLFDSDSNARRWNASP